MHIPTFESTRRRPLGPCKCRLKDGIFLATSNCRPSAFAGDKLQPASTWAQRSSPRGFEASISKKLGYLCLVIAIQLCCNPGFSQNLPLPETPLFIGKNTAPLVMITMDRSHALYAGAYDDNSDLDHDGAINAQFKPSFHYFGYFDSNKCYDYNAQELYFYPIAFAEGDQKKCLNQSWSGNFLNYITMSKLDIFRKMIYGGYRTTDTPSETILERSYVPQDDHSRGVDYQTPEYNGYIISDYTPFLAPKNQKAHLFASTTLRNGNGLPILRVALDQPYRIWDWLNIAPPVADARAFDGKTGPLISGITDYVVRVKVCTPINQDPSRNFGLESNCRLYPNKSEKPTGILQKFSENNAIYFGLLTGSYGSNLNGGILRKNISDINDEIDLNTGQFKNSPGIIDTLNRLTVTGFGKDYTYDCGNISTRDINNGECVMWGNPLAEMLYETVRYFAGKMSPTSAFHAVGGADVDLGLPNPNWIDPYTTYPACSKAVALVLTASPPSYDSDLLPGSIFMGLPSDLSPALDVTEIGQTIFAYSGLGKPSVFIGQVGKALSDTPSAKTIDSFGNIRGLNMRSANQQGSYYLASVAYYAWLNDLNLAKGKQNMQTISVAFTPPLAEFKFKIDHKTITIAPIAKTVQGEGINPEQGNFQPTDEIVSTYVESLTNNQAIFRVNFSNAQQAGDYSTHVSVQYIITINQNRTLTVKTNVVHATGDTTEHIGYVISGTTEDGVYISVRDNRTPSDQDVDYYLDTPPHAKAGQAWQDLKALPTSNTRTFTPSNSPTLFLNSPLWFAAKWGGFNDSNGNNLPDLNNEFSDASSSEPDNYISANNPAAIQSKLSRLLTRLVNVTGTFSRIALNTGALQDSTLIFQTLFRSNVWTGNLLSFKLDPITADPAWSNWNAQVLLDATPPASRTIITYNPDRSIGVPFKWTQGQRLGLSENQKNILSTNPVTHQHDNLGPARADFLRGVRDQEIQKGGSFRNRQSVFGDIIDSNPIYVGPPNQAYPNHWKDQSPENTSPYQHFKHDFQDRSPMIYVGANDGMLHGFDARTGREKLAFIPASIFSHLNLLTSPDYTHQFFVDGYVTVMDAFIHNTWRTILVGGLNAGGKGMFALDVTDPTQFTEKNAARLVKWEFTELDDSDLGYTYSEPTIARLNNGQWAAIFGNGYNNTNDSLSPSQTGNAVLYIVDLESGALIKKFDTQVGTKQDPLNQGRANGLSSPAVISATTHATADYIYAGDLFGNLWKIDIRSNNPDQWHFAFTQNNTGLTKNDEIRSENLRATGVYTPVNEDGEQIFNKAKRVFRKSYNKPTPFFIATDPTGHRQPITSKPAVSGLSDTSGGFNIYFGTGAYFRESDKTDLQIQSIYGLLDQQNMNIPNRNVLLSQNLIRSSDNQRMVSDHTITSERGWVLDLVMNDSPQGERLLSPLRYLNKQLIFTTLTPTQDPCDYGGTSWLMALNPDTGGRLSFDAFMPAPQSNSGDQSVPKSGITSTVGLMPLPAILNAGSTEYLYFSGTAGGLFKIEGNPGSQIYGRQSWLQLE